MARKPKIQQTKPATNGFDPDVLNSIVGRIEQVFVELDSLRGTYMQDCKSFREDIANLYDEAKARGVPPKSLKKAVKARELNRKIEALREDLDLVDRETYDQIRHALGDLADTPLGDAALNKAARPIADAIDRGELSIEFPGAGPNGETVTIDKATREAAAKNAAALEAGIKPLKPKGPKLGAADADGSYKAVN